MKELVKVDAKDFGLEETKAAQIAAQFKPMLDKMVELEKEYNEIVALDINDPETSEKAAVVRRKYVKVRTGTAEIHKKQKAFYRSGGLYVDGWKNAQIFASQGIEGELMKIEKHAENLEKERIEKLQNERFEICKPFVVDEMEILPNLGTLPDSIWDNYISGLEVSCKARIEAEKKAEKERIAAEKAEIERQKAIEAENLKLKKEAEENAKKQEAEQKERERLAKIEADKQAKINADRLAKEAEEKKAYEAKLKAEREEKQRLENEIKAKKEAEQKAIEEAEVLKQAELNKGDAAKVKDLIKDLEALKTRYTFKSEKNNKKYKGVGELLDKVVDYINK